MPLHDGPSTSPGAPRLAKVIQLMGRTLRGRGSLSSIDVRVFYWLTSIAWFVFGGMNLLSHTSGGMRDLASLLPWVGSLVVIQSLPIAGYRSASLTSDSALVAAASVILSPVEVGIVMFVGSFDPKEIKREISLPKALFNRSQLAIGSSCASLVIHHLIQGPEVSPSLLPIALASLGVNVALNYLFVAIAIALEHRLSPIRVVQCLRIGDSSDFTLTLATWGVLAAMLVASYELMGPWALFAFLLPALLGRQVLVRSQMWKEAAQAYQTREQALLEMTQRLAEERSDERRLVAADLHDDVLQPLFKVTLMANVLKADLAQGRLLQLEEDLPELLQAADIAGSALRELIGDLRRSNLGRGGVGPALRSLARALGRQASAQISSDISDIDADSILQIVVYQIAKESLTNAVTHSRATQIEIRLKRNQDLITLQVKDDGVGFDKEAQATGHFGIPIMRERAASIGGSLYLDTAPGSGCVVTLVVPEGTALAQKES